MAHLKIWNYGISSEKMPSLAEHFILRSRNLQTLESITQLLLQEQLKQGRAILGQGCKYELGCNLSRKEQSNGERAISRNIYLE